MAEDVEGDARAPVLDRLGLHLDAAGHELVADEDRRDAVEDAVAGRLDVAGHLVLEGQHALDVQVTGPRDEVPLVGVLGGELVADQVAAIIEVAVGNEVVVADGVPSGRLDHADTPPLLGGHRLTGDDRHGAAAPAEGIKRGIGLRW